MSRFDCEEQEATAPRVGCRCRACYRARERVLDPRLIELVHDSFPYKSVASPATELVRRAIDGYLAGHIEFAALHIEIILALVRGSDELFKQVMASSALQPRNVIQEPD